MKRNYREEIHRIAEAVATIRRVDRDGLFSPVRVSEKVASARTFAMGACAAATSIAHAARAFGREWRTVYNAEKSCERRRRNSASFTKEWETVIAQVSPERQPAEVSGV